MCGPGGMASGWEPWVSAGDLDGGGMVPGTGLGASGRLGVSDYAWVCGLALDPSSHLFLLYYVPLHITESGRSSSNNKTILLIR